MLRLTHGFTRFSTLTRCFTAVARRPVFPAGQHAVSVARCMSGGHHDFKPDKLLVKEQKTSLDDIPIPQGSFADYHGKRNAKWNLYLGASLVLFGITVYTMCKTGVLYLHGHPPMKNKKPEKEIEPVTASPLAASKPPPKAESKAPVAPPAGSAALPEHVPYLIVGGGTTAFAAFRAIRSQEPTAKVLVVSSESHAPYMRPPLSKEMWFTEDRDAVKELKFTQWNGRERSLYFEKEAFYCQPGELADRETGGVALALNRKVTKLDVENQKAILEDGSEVKYDKCLIATGGRPKNLPVFEKAGSQVMRRVTLFRTVEDFHKLDATLNAAKSVAIVGGGFLGSELACALAKRGRSSGLQVTQVFADKGNMGMVLPEYLSKWTTRKIEEEGAKVISNALVDSVTSQVDGRVNLRLNNGESVIVDHVVVAVGLEPNTELARSSGLELSTVHGGFLVNAELEARTNLWVAGDAACFYDTSLGRRRVEHHDHAVVSGRLAGENMTGAHKPYAHQSMFWSDLGPNIGYEAIGLVDSSLPTVAVFAKAEERDTPKAVVEETGEGLRSETEQNAPQTEEKTIFHAPADEENYGKGIIFYLRDNVVVGLVMWNVFNKMPIARKILKENVKEDEIAEISKLFNLYEKPVPNMP